MRGAAPVRLEVRETGDAIYEVREERAWPLPGTRWTALHLGAGTLQPSAVKVQGTTRFTERKGRASFVLVGY